MFVDKLDDFVGKCENVGSSRECEEKYEFD